MFLNLQRNLKSPDNPAFWGKVTSSVDWCEVNYQVNPFIAEFFNTASSFAMAIVGLMGILLHPWAERRFKIAFLATVVVGLGSVAFHGTLKKFAQALDEVPMLYSAFSFAYIGICQTYKLKSSTQYFLALALCAYAALTTVLVTVFHGVWQFVIFHISFGTANIYAFVIITQYLQLFLIVIGCISAANEGTPKMIPQYGFLSAV